MRFSIVPPLAAALLLSIANLRAATLIYDDDATVANGITDGATTGWNTVSTVWFDGTNDVAWTNSTTNVAQFGGGSSGTAGSVTVGTVTANGIRFEPPFAGNYTLTGGTITLGGTTPTITTDADATITSTIAGTAGFIKAGSGMLTLSGNNSGLTGGVTLNAGTLQAVDTTTTATGNQTLVKVLGANTSPLTLNAGTLQIRANGDGTTTAQTLTFGAYNTVVGGDVTISVDRASGSGTTKTIAFGTLSIGTNTLTVTGGDAYILRFGTATLTGDVTFNTTTAGLTLNAISGGTHNVTKQGAAALVLSTSSTFGNLTITGGNVDLTGTNSTADVNVSGSGNFTTHSGETWTMNSLTYTSTSTVSNFNAQTVDSTYTIGTGGFTMSAGTITVVALNAGVTSKVILMSNATINGTSSLAASGSGNKLLDLNNASRTFTVSSGATFTVAPVIQNGAIDKEGAGTLKFTGANTYAGGTIINGGTVQTSGSGTLGATTADLTINTGGTLDVVGTSQTVNNFGGTGGTVTNSSSTAGTFTVGSNGGGGIFAGSINNGTGSLALVKNGAGTLTLTGSSTYTGGTTLNAGILAGSDATAYSGTNPTITKLFGTGTMTLNSGTLQIRIDGDSTTAAQTLSYGNNVVIGGDMTIDANRLGSTATTKTVAFGNLSIGANTLSIVGGNGYVVRFNTTTLTGNSTFNVGTGASLTFNSAVVGGTNSITKSGAGLLTMQGGTFGDLNITAGQADLFVTTTTGNVTVSGSGIFTTHSGDNWTMTSLTHNSSGTSNFTALATDSTYTIGVGGLSMSAGTILFNTTTTTGVNAKAVLLGDANITGTSSFTVNGSGNKLLDFNGGTRTFNISSGATFSVAPVIQNGGLVKSGAGVMVVTGANTYAGGTTISQGTFLANNTTGSATGSGQVTVSGGTLGGTGILGPTGGNTVLVNGTGTINPGIATADRTGTLTINSNLVMDASAGATPSITMEIEGKSAGLFDRIAGINNFALDGVINVTFINGFTGSTLVAGDNFDLFDWATADATNFNVNSDLMLPNISSFGLAWDSTHFLDAGSAGGVISVVTSTPEPSRGLLCLMAMGMVTMRRRRR